jgi:hypothetical protein
MSESPELYSVKDNIDSGIVPDCFSNRPDSLEHTVSSDLASGKRLSQRHSPHSMAQRLFRDA